MLTNLEQTATGSVAVGPGRAFNTILSVPVGSSGPDAEGFRRRGRRGGRAERRSRPERVGGRDRSRVPTVKEISAVHESPGPRCLGPLVTPCPSSYTRADLETAIPAGKSVEVLLAFTGDNVLPFLDWSYGLYTTDIPTQEPDAATADLFFQTARRYPLLVIYGGLM